MLLMGMLFALFTVGLVVPCLIDVARTPQFAIRTLTKRTWVLILLLLSVVGAAAWIIAGRPARSWPTPMRHRHLAGLRGLRQQDALRRHPAARLDEYAFGLLHGLDAGYRDPRPLGPDDDPDFLQELERRIRDREAGNDA